LRALSHGLAKIKATRDLRTAGSKRVAESS